MKNAKRIGSFICLIAICVTLVCAPSANAAGTPLLGGQQFGALIASGLLSLNIIANTALQSAPIQKLWEWCSAPTAEDRINYLFPVLGDTISDYMNASTIRVNQGVVTIDGVEYDELWISPGTFTDGLKTDLFDFKTKWAVLSGQAGTLASGEGYLGNIPMYNVNGTIRSQGISSKYYWNFNNEVIIQAEDVGSNGREAYQYRNGTKLTPYLNLFSNRTDDIVYYLTLDNIRANSGGYNYYATYRYKPTYISQPFQFDYVSGEIPQESEIPQEYGLSLKIPHDKLETFYNTYPQYNVDNTTINIAEDEVDIDQLTAAIFDLIDSMEDMKAEWTNGEQPEPPTPVDPIDNIDQNVQDISEYQQDMQQQVDHMHQDVEAIHQTQQQQQQTQQQIQQDTSSIDSTLKDVTAVPGQSDLPSFKFDLRELFPFCIPFDIYRLLSSFDATPQAPHVRLPIVIQSIGFSYTMDLDFSAWDPVAQAMRTAELIVYAIGLAWATGKVIKW